MAHWQTTLAITSIMASMTATVHATSPIKAAKPVACLSAIGRSADAQLTCRHEAWLTPQERTDLKQLTRGYLTDARCTITVSVARTLIDAALAASDSKVEVPPQPVTCGIQTSGGPMTVQGTFAPTVTFKDGFAVLASPGLANVTGVNSYLAWPVVQYVNRSPTIGMEMVVMINAFRSKLGSRQAAR